MYSVRWYSVDSTYRAYFTHRMASTCKNVRKREETINGNSTHIDTCKSEEYVEIKCQLDATEVFIADLIACSTCFGHHYAHHQELKSIIQWLLPVVFRVCRVISCVGRSTRVACVTKLCSGSLCVAHICYRIDRVHGSKEEIFLKNLYLTSSLLDPNIFLTTLFSNTLSLRSSLIVSDQVSHPHKTTGNIIVLYILIFTTAAVDSNRY